MGSLFFPKGGIFVNGLAGSGFLDVLPLWVWNDLVLSSALLDMVPSVYMAMHFSHPYCACGMPHASY